MGEAAVASFDGLDGPAVELQLVKDMARRALLVTPVMILVFGLVWGLGGALSTAYAVGIVLANFAIAAALDAWAARINLGLLMFAALFGFLIRLGLILIALLVAHDAWWYTPVPLGITIIVTHLGLLFWEVRYVSASLAFPGLKPSKTA